MKRHPGRLTMFIVALTMSATLCCTTSASFAGQRPGRSIRPKASAIRYQADHSQPAAEPEGATESKTAKPPAEASAPPVIVDEEYLESEGDEFDLFEPSHLAGSGDQGCGSFCGGSSCGNECPGLLEMYCSCGVWADLDYLMYWRQGRDLPALVTTDPDDGILPDATVLFGDEQVGDEARPGGRLRIGTWLGRSGCFSLEASFLALADGQVTFETDSTINDTIARPFFNLTDDLQGGVVGNDALQVALAGTSTGSISVSSSSDVWLADVIWRGMLCDIDCMRLDLLAGYAASRIDEDLLIISNTVIDVGGNEFDVRDSFVTENQFNGGVIGFELTRSIDRVNLSFLGRVGLGNMRQTVIINGQQTVTVAGDDPTTSEGGLLAQSTNIGTRSRDGFAVNPELGIRLNYQLTKCLNFTAGYSFFYWNKVVQPGDQIDFSINPDQPPDVDAEQRPAFAFREGDYHLHGLNVGFQLVY